MKNLTEKVLWQRSSSLNNLNSATVFFSQYDEVITRLWEILDQFEIVVQIADERVQKLAQDLS